MVVPSVVSVVAAEQPPAKSSQASIEAVNTSIARYLAAADRVRILTDVGLKVCVALLVLVALAWAIGLLPGAVKLF